MNVFLNAELLNLYLFYLKRPSSNYSCTLNFKSECPFRYKKAIIHNLISRAKLIFSSKTIFYKEVEILK